MNNKQCSCNKDKAINDLLKRVSNLEFEVESKEKENERLNKENEELKKIQCTYLGTGCKAELERLNNIINEFEKWLKDYIKLFDKPDMLEEQTLEDLKEVLDKLQELKGKKKIGEVVSPEELESYLPQNDYEVMEQDLLFKD